MAQQTPPLISAAELQQQLQAAQPPVVLDCGFDLADPDAGERAYVAGHIPGAQYAHLDRDLAAPTHPAGPRHAAFTGRHPLPDRAELARQAGRWGIGPDVPVVVYDAQGSPYAARAWWLLRWLGHDAVRVLDGGRAAWLAQGGTLTTAATPVTTLPPYPERAPSMPSVDAATLLSRLGSVRIVDARALERWRGDVEPLDPVGGHIPGSTPRFFKDNLQADGRFRSPEDLRAAFAALGITRADETVHQCGSGVTACHNLLALAHAGLGTGRLYPGSWSEWCADPARPLARG